MRRARSGEEGRFQGVLKRKRRHRKQSGELPDPRGEGVSGTGIARAYRRSRPENHALRIGKRPILPDPRRYFRSRIGFQTVRGTFELVFRRRRFRFQSRSVPQRFGRTVRLSVRSGGYRAKIARTHRIGIARSQNRKKGETPSGRFLSARAGIRSAQGFRRDVHLRSRVFEARHGRRSGLLIGRRARFVKEPSRPRDVLAKGRPFRTFRWDNEEIERENGRLERLEKRFPPRRIGLRTSAGRRMGNCRRRISVRVPDTSDNDLGCFRRRAHPGIRPLRNRKRFRLTRTRP